MLFRVFQSVGCGTRAAASAESTASGRSGPFAAPCAIMGAGRSRVNTRIENFGLWVEEGGGLQFTARAFHCGLGLSGEVLLGPCVTQKRIGILERLSGTSGRTRGTRQCCDRSASAWTIGVVATWDGFIDDVGLTARGR